jgi:putative sigma-54 modulation protein
MEVEFTARQVKLSKGLRMQAEEGMERISRILGKDARASVTLSAQKHIQIVELTVLSRAHKIAATGKGAALSVALKQAMEHAEHQALKYRDRRLGSKRLPKEEKTMTAPPIARTKTRAAQPPEESNGHKQKRSGASIPVHSFPAKAAVVEPHILRTSHAVAIAPMTIEEAVKDAEFRDRDLLIFRTGAGEMFVLHRRRDGQMELVEIP